MLQACTNNGVHGTVIEPKEYAMLPSTRRPYGINKEYEAHLTQYFSDAD